MYIVDTGHDLKLQFGSAASLATVLRLLELEFFTLIAFVREETLFIENRWTGVLGWEIFDCVRACHRQCPGLADGKERLLYL